MNGTIVVEKPSYINQILNSNYRLKKRLTFYVFEILLLNQLNLIYDEIFNSTFYFLPGN